MKAKFIYLLLLVITLCTSISCTSDNPSDSDGPDVIIPVYNYTELELETMNLINNYRLSKGLKSLQKSDYISYKAEEHNKYMIANNVVKHDNFSTRSTSIMNVLGATVVAENLAYNVDTAPKVLDDWLASNLHKASIEGDFTHFGLSVRVNSDGRKYYTNIFAKI